MLTLYNFRLDKVDQEMSHLVLAQISSDCSLSLILAPKMILSLGAAI